MTQKQKLMMHQLAQMTLFRYMRHPEKLGDIHFQDAEWATAFVDEITQLIKEKDLPKGTIDVLSKLVRVVDT